MALCVPKPLADRHDLSAFDCGRPSLNEWLRLRARRNQEQGFTVVRVVHEQNRVVGYYGLAPSGVLAPIPPRAIRMGQPPLPLPVILLGQLAVDHQWQGKGLGDSLLIHALGRCIAAAELIGGRAVMVTAIDATAARYWQARGFIPARGDPLTLFRSIADIRRSLEGA